jgi:hypothetical protein
MDLLSMIQAIPGIGPYLPYVLMLFGVCAVIAAQLPAPRSSGVYSMIYGIVNLLGHNYNQARNALAPAAKAPAPPAAVLVLAYALTMSLMACSNTGSPSADTAALEAGLTAAEGVATAYVQLPLCTGSNGPLCSDATIVAQIKNADAKAYALVKAAENAAGDPSALSAAELAITALTTITANLPKKGS